MSPQGRRLVLAFRQFQRSLSDRTLARLAQLWPMLISGRLERTTEPWLAASTVVVADSHTRSTVAGAAFYRQLRMAEAGAVDVNIVRPSHDPVRTRRILLGAGPGLIRANLARGLSFDQAAEKAEYWATGQGTREALSGGRETLRATSVRDGRSGGWARAAEGDACAFCAMLASRGYVYGEETAEFQAHRGCQCFAVPAFSRNQALPDNSEEFRQQWEESDGTLQDFRRLREGRDGEQA